MTGMEKTLQVEHGQGGDSAGSERLTPQRGKPPWIRVRLPSGESYERVKALMRAKSLHTVCEEARCPNISECWGRGTATFLILGEWCTRGCGFCAVRSGKPPSSFIDPSEALNVAEAVAAMKLRHAVVTSVTRDDLPDGGAFLFAETVRAIRTRIPGCTVEVLIPDFNGNLEALASVMRSSPDILGHNMETVVRLYPRVRPQADYRRSLELLKAAKKMQPKTLTKSGFMVGMGETWLEMLALMQALREASCDILTIGQYLRPSQAHLSVRRYYTPQEFQALKEAGLRAGFRWVESGPLVRSSYHAEAYVG